MDFDHHFLWSLWVEVAVLINNPIRNSHIAGNLIFFLLWGKPIVCLSSSLFASMWPGSLLRYWPHRESTCSCAETSRFLKCLRRRKKWNEGIYVERIHNKQSSKAIEKHKKKDRRNPFFKLGASSQCTDRWEYFLFNMMGPVHALVADLTLRSVITLSKKGYCHYSWCYCWVNK